MFLAVLDCETADDLVHAFRETAGLNEGLLGEHTSAPLEQAVLYQRNMAGLFSLTNDKMFRNCVSVPLELSVMYRKRLQLFIDLDTKVCTFVFSVV